MQDRSAKGTDAILPRRILAGLGTLLLAAAVATTSGANFNAVSSNSANSITAGIVRLTNDKNGQAILAISALAPGHSASATADMTNSGDVDADLSMAASAVTDTPASPSLSSKLDLVVTDLGDPACSTGCPASATIYSGKLGALTSASAGRLAPLGIHRLRFTVTFPDGGAGADNAYQEARAAVDLTWTLAQR